MMNRRSLLLSLSAGLAACGKKKVYSSTEVLTAGPFKVGCPRPWHEGAIIEQVPTRPVYNEDAWRAYKENSSFALKPAYSNRPEHWAIRFPKLATANAPFVAAEAGDSEIAPQILIHQAEGWAGIMQNGEADETARKQLASSLRGELKDLLKKDDALKTPAFLDASFNFLCLKQPLAFKTGWGVRVVGQWTIEPSLMSNTGLHYLFMGVCDDNTCHIIATFPLEVPGLPGGADLTATHLGFSTKNYEELSKKFDDYEKKACEWLKSQEAKITPKLKDLDALIESLEVETWPV